MRERLPIFAADLSRFGPLGVVSFATVVCLPSLREFLSGQLAIGSMLGRYCAALFLASIGVRTVSWVLLRYAIKNATEAGVVVERGESGSVTGQRPPNGASERRN
ncbi:MAG: hypothetical protein ABSG36_03045 [Acidimicrobiales bacterium]|jgi:hypothetical protein